MSHANAAEMIPNLERLGNVVPEGYSYYEKLITPGKDLSLPTAYLKWYDLYPVDMPITPEQDAETRAFLTHEGANLHLKDELGFIILHRAGSWLLLMLNLWRNTNEIWEAAYAKDLRQAADYVPIPGDHNLRGTFCVWELGAVWHERHAWVRYLKSAHDNAAKLAYINDKFTGQL